jgi:phage shock protein PspC (stress-responsive transcriptional regulator)
VLAGVCGGVARYFGIDPVIARIVAIVLVFFGGAGALLYLAAVLLVPNEGEAGVAPPEERNRWLVVLGAVALICVVGPFLLVPAAIAGGLLFPLAFLIVVALVVAWLVTGRWPEREAGPIARATAIGIGVLVILTLVATGSFWGAAVGGDEVVAGLVIAAGAAVLAGAFVKPVRWLIPLALALAIPAGFVGAAGIELDGGIGEKRYHPGTAAEIRDHYEIGIGELVVDLRGADLRAGEDREIDIDVGMGHALLLVDDDVCVATRAEVGAGQVDVFRVGNGGVDVDVDDMPRADAGSPRVVIDGDVGLGYLEVAHEEHPDTDWDHRFDVDRGENTGCVGA